MTGFFNREESLSTPVLAPDTHVRRGFIWRVSLIAGLGGVLYGYDMGVIAAALVYVRQCFVLSTRMQEVVVSVVLVGAMSGRPGRRRHRGSHRPPRYAPLGRRHFSLWLAAGALLTQCCHSDPRAFPAGRSCRVHLCYRTCLRLGTGSPALTRHAHRPLSVRSHIGIALADLWAIGWQASTPGG